MEDRIHSQQESEQLFAVEKADEPYGFRRQLAPETVEAMESKLSALKRELCRQKDDIGVSFKHETAMDDVIHNAMISL